MKNLVMFDMDGVLFNTMPCHAEAWVKTVREIGRDIPAEVFYLNEGRNGESMIRELLGSDAGYKELYKRKSHFYDELPPAPVMPGAIEALRAVRCRVLAVNTGPLDDSLLLNEGADELFHSMSELTDALPALLES